MPKPSWKLFEENVQSYLEKRMERERIVYHRFYDTHSAQGLLPAQPSDHLIETERHSILLETKYSAVHASLRSCFSDMVDDNQIAHMRVWMRSAAITLILFRGTQGMELWEGGHCAYCRLNGKRLDPGTILKTGDSFPEVLENLYLRFPNTEMEWRIL